MDVPRAVYIGDILQRDMVMAVEAGTVAVWARYGTRHEPWAAEFIERISPWTEQEITSFKAKEGYLEEPLRAKGMREVDRFSDVLKFSIEWRQQATFSR